MTEKNDATPITKKALGIVALENALARIDEDLGHAKAAAVEHARAIALGEKIAGKTGGSAQKIAELESLRGATQQALDQELALTLQAAEMEKETLQAEITRLRNKQNAELARDHAEMLELMKGLFLIFHRAHGSASTITGLPTMCRFPELRVDAALIKKANAELQAAFAPGATAGAHATGQMVAELESRLNNFSATVFLEEALAAARAQGA